MSDYDFELDAWPDFDSEDDEAMGKSMLQMEVLILACLTCLGVATWLAS